MTNEATPVAASADAHSSQIIEHQDTLETPRAGQVPETEAPKPEPKLSTREAIAKAFDENEAKVKEKAEAAAKDAGEKVKEAEQVEKPAKARAEDGKFAKAEQVKAEDPAQVDAKADQGAAEKPAAGQETADKSRQSEGRQHQEPPARFLPEAREKWGPTPYTVKAEMHRVTQEYETELTAAKESASKYEEIRQYDDMARQNGRGGVKDSLAKMVQIEQALARNPVIGLEAILREVGPRKPDGSPVSLYEIAQHVARLTPQQYAQNMQGAVPQARQPQPQANSEVAALKSELSEIKSTLAQQRAAPIIESFAASHPDYHALQPQIAEVLKSGVVDRVFGSGLSPEQKLAEAYRMVGGRSAPSHSDPQPAAPVNSQANTAPPVDPDGQKSVRGAPTSGQTGEAPRKFKTNRAALEAAFASVPR